MKKEIIEKWIQDAYGIAKAHGFHDVEHRDGHWLMLITTEIAEAVEADRKGLVADYDAFSYCSDHRKYVYATYGQESPLGKQYHHEVLFEKYIKNTLEDELADIVIRCCDYLGSNGVNFAESFTEELMKEHSFSNGFYDTFAEKTWEWVAILNENSIPVGARIVALLLEVIYFCEAKCIDIQRHVEWKMKYNQSRPQKHGKAY